MTKSKRAFEELLADLDSPDYKVRRAAARDMGWLRDPRGVEPLIRALKDKTVNVRSRAVVALVRIGDPCAVEPLIQTFADSHCHVHRPAYETLLRWGAAVVPSLCDALHDPNRYVRGTSAILLGEIGDVRAIEPLRGLLQDELDDVRRAAERALGKLERPRDISK